MFLIGLFFVSNVITNHIDQINTVTDLQKQNMLAFMALVVSTILFSIWSGCVNEISWSPTKRLASITILTNIVAFSLIFILTNETVSMFVILCIGILTGVIFGLRFNYHSGFGGGFGGGAMAVLLTMILTNPHQSLSGYITLGWFFVFCLLLITLEYSIVLYRSNQNKIKLLLIYPKY